MFKLEPALPWEISLDPALATTCCQEFGLQQSTELVCRRRGMHLALPNNEPDYLTCNPTSRHGTGYTFTWHRPTVEPLWDRLRLLGYFLDQPSTPYRAYVLIATEARRLHITNLVVTWLSMGYETWLPIGRLHPFVVGWSKYRLGLPIASLHYEITWPVAIPTVYETPVTVPYHSPNGRQKTAVKAVQGDCEKSRTEACDVMTWKTFSALLTVYEGSPLVIQLTKGQ